MGEGRKKEEAREGRLRGDGKGGKRGEMGRKFLKIEKL